MLHPAEVLPQVADQLCRRRVLRVELHHQLGQPFVARRLVDRDHQHRAEGARFRPGALLVEARRTADIVLVTSILGGTQLGLGSVDRAPERRLERAPHRVPGHPGDEVPSRPLGSAREVGVKTRTGIAHGGSPGRRDLRRFGSDEAMQTSKGPPEAVRIILGFIQPIADLERHALRVHDRGLVFFDRRYDPGVTDIDEPVAHHVPDEDVTGLGSIGHGIPPTIDDRKLLFEGIAF